MGAALNAVGTQHVKEDLEDLEDLEDHFLRFRFFRATVRAPHVKGAVGLVGLFLRIRFFRRMRGSA